MKTNAEMQDRQLKCICTHKHTYIHTDTHTDILRACLESRFRCPLCWNVQSSICLAIRLSICKCMCVCIAGCALPPFPVRRGELLGKCSTVHSPKSPSHANSVSHFAPPTNGSWPNCLPHGGTATTTNNNSQINALPLATL